MYEGQLVLDSLKLAPPSHPSENYDDRCYQCNSIYDDGDDDDCGDDMLLPLSHPSENHNSYYQ